MGIPQTAGFETFIVTSFSESAYGRVRLECEALQQVRHVGGVAKLVPAVLNRARTARQSLV